MDQASIVDKKDENPFWNGQSGVQFIKDVHDGKVFKGKYKDLGIVLQKVKTSTLDNYGTFNEQYQGFGNLYLTAKEVNGLVTTGYLNKTQISNLGDIVESTTSDSAKVTEYRYLIRWYDKTDGIFPKILQVFRLSCGQPTSKLSHTQSPKVDLRKLH